MSLKLVIIAFSSGSAPLLTCFPNNIVPVIHAPLRGNFRPFAAPKRAWICSKTEFAALLCLSLCALSRVLGSHLSSDELVPSVQLCKAYTRPFFWKGHSRSSHKNYLAHVHVPCICTLCLWSFAHAAVKDYHLVGLLLRAFAKFLQWDEGNVQRRWDHFAKFAILETNIQFLNRTSKGIQLKVFYCKTFGKLEFVANKLWQFRALRFFYAFCFDSVGSGQSGIIWIPHSQVLMLWKGHETLWAECLQIGSSEWLEMSSLFQRQLEVLRQ